ncbi:hypothetical protein Godav_023460 [Gossypium davidsonii]|uniref:Uncharacterized protein n=2 Tax=Gossypium TaxID=3633 RepID=A0A7J8SSB5_GOSDV|nr:hypothetical protein [Gossypium davidsonii]MBA0664499.1 hypothetical protein [Gossypium klotzschianum]
MGKTRRAKSFVEAMVEAESFVKLGPRKVKFDFSKPKKTGNDGNGRDYPKKSMIFVIEGDDEPDKELMRLGSILSFFKDNRVRKNENKLVKCFLYSGLHRMRDYLERSKLSTVTKEDEVEPENETLKLKSLILKSTKENKDHKQKGLMHVDINIADQ